MSLPHSCSSSTSRGRFLPAMILPSDDMRARLRVVTSISDPTGILSVPRPSSESALVSNVAVLGRSCFVRSLAIKHAMGGGLAVGCHGLAGSLPHGRCRTTGDPRLALDHTGADSAFGRAHFVGDHEARTNRDSRAMHDRPGPRLRTACGRRGSSRRGAQKRSGCGCRAAIRS